MKKYINKIYNKIYWSYWELVFNIKTKFYTFLFSKLDILYIIYNYDGNGTLEQFTLKVLKDGVLDNNQIWKKYLQNNENWGLECDLIEEIVC